MSYIFAKKCHTSLPKKTKWKIKKFAQDFITGYSLIWRYWLPWILNLYLVFQSALLNCPGSCWTLHLRKSPFVFINIPGYYAGSKFSYLFAGVSVSNRGAQTDRFSSSVKYWKFGGRASRGVPTKSFPTQISHYPVSLISQIVLKEIICTFAM